MKRPLIVWSPRRGLTLLELLVVIAMIAVLAGLLFPIIAASRNRARETPCISQLRQIGQAVQMYIDDYTVRPPHLHNLLPQYAGDPKLFICANDAWLERGGWAWSAWGRKNGPSREWPLAVSYGYFWTHITRVDDLWEVAQQLPGRPGFAACVLHGRPHPREPDPGEAPYYRGLVLRLCFDGSVVRRKVVARLFPQSPFNAWQIMTDSECPPGDPRPACQEAADGSS
jgi:prepilin-type N-terminal cleavage/methylation domain-containing protein